MTKLSDLTPEQRREFHSSIIGAIQEGRNAKELQDYLASHMGKVFGQRMLQRYMEKRRKPSSQQTPPSKAKDEHLTMTGTGSDIAEVSGLIRGQVVTLDDAIKKANVDLSKWDVDRWEITSWEMGYKDKEKEPGVLPLWRVNVKLKAKRGWNPSEFRAILVKDIKSLSPVYAPVRYSKVVEPLLSEVSLFDAHFGKLAWSPETGQDYDIKICRTRYMHAGRSLIYRAAAHKPERFLFPFGNDFFHVDHKGQTTSGTTVDCDGRWQKAFRIGTQCAIDLLQEASKIAPVDVVIVPGNHDREKAFCLGEVLAAYFHNNHDVNIMNDPNPFVYYRWGKVLLGFNHGEEYTGDKKRSELPIQMSTDRPVDWSETVWREFHLGHFHSEDEMVWKYRTAKQVRDITVRVLPSLSGTDAWHRMKGYASPLAAECHLYHKNLGRWEYLVHQTEP